MDLLEGSSGGSGLLLRRRGSSGVLGVVLLLVVLGSGCGRGEGRADVALLPLAEPVAGGAASGGGLGARAASGTDREPRRVGVGNSERLALVTTMGAAWEVEVELAEGDRLAWSSAAPAAAPGAGAETASGLLALRPADGRERILWQGETRSSDGWEGVEIDVPDSAVEAAADGPVRLRLSSEAPFAWAELSLLRRDAAPPARPNLLLVSIDTLRADRLGLYGAERDTSPHLDRFAADALVFERALSSSTWTLPSHGTLFTGLLPDQHGLLGVQDRLGSGTPTVAARLHRLGYRTVAITDGGFLGPRWGLSAGFDRYDTTPGHPWEPKDVAVVVAAARRWLEENDHEPYFLFVHTYETHQPYRNREGFADRFLPRGVDRTTPVVAFDLADFPADPDEAERARAFYDGGVARADHYLGAWLEELQEGGALARTAVIVTSDHGEELGEHGAYEHGLGRLFDENVRVPMIVRPPGGAAREAPRRVAVPVTSLDVAPTLLAWAGASAPLPGRPLPDLAESGSAERPVLVHGSASLQERYERRYRLDQGTDSMIFDRVRGRVLFVDRSADPAMRRVRRLWWPGLAAQGAGTAEPPGAKAAAMVARHQAVQAWLEGEAMATPLPAGAAAVQVRRTSALTPLGVWVGADWRELRERRRRAETAPGWPALLRFELLPGSRPRRVWLEGLPAEAKSGRPPRAPRELPLVARRELRQPDWNPVDGVLPRPGEVFRAAPRTQPLVLELDEAARQELLALGYLR